MNKWKDSMVEKYGSEEAFREHMRAIANKSSRNKHGTPYLKKLAETDPAKFKELSSKGGKGNVADNN